MKLSSVAMARFFFDDRVLLSDRYTIVRKRTESICAPLKPEDYVVQPVIDVSPPKWHLGHTTWFFEQFVLKDNAEGYKIYNDDFHFVFNSYYESLGPHLMRTDRGNLTRPWTEEVYNYRRYVDEAMLRFIGQDVPLSLTHIIQLGLNHEEQHQELLCTDIKYILGHNPLFPCYTDQMLPAPVSETPAAFINIPEGIYTIGYGGDGFHFDNEGPAHRVFLEAFRIRTIPVTNREYLEFMDDGGYHDFRHWHAEGWEWVRENNIRSPLYWHFTDGKWVNYTLQGLQTVLLDEPVCHISFYEAAAYASWKGMRLSTESEWEIAAPSLDWGLRWEWTESAYLPYPGFRKRQDAIGEYNAKFMVNQKVLRGKSVVTPPDHSRVTYRNFFHPHLRWQYTGIRLAESLNV